MTVGYTLHGYDNDSYMYEGVENTNPPLCTKCGFLLTFEYHNPFFKIKKTNFDLSHPYDLGHIVSLRFKEFIERGRYSDIRLKEFERSPGFFHFFVDKKLEFDYERRKTKLIDRCEGCGNYAEIIGSTPAFLKNVDRGLEDGFCRTDLIFGSYNSKKPVLIVGVQTFEKLKKENLKGLIFKEIKK